jgi:hypothetical protein
VKPSETAGRLICRKVLGDHSAVRDRFNAGVELNADPVSQRNASFISKKNVASPSPRSFCRSLDRGGSPTRGGHLKWFAEAPRLVLDD